MKLYIFLLFCSIGLVQATNSYAQKATVNLKMQNQTVQTVLNEIENQSEFSFFFNTKHVDLQRRVTITVKDGDIFRVLDNIFADTDVQYAVVDKKIVLSNKPQIIRQDGKKKITGIVKDENGDPVIGANVVVKGSTIGNITDIGGEFTLNVPEKGILEISYIGFVTQSFNLSDKSEFNIILYEDKKILEEVVVVGYGTVKKSDLTGAISQIDPTKREERLTVNATDLLRNSIAGLNVPFSTNAKGSVDMNSISIRGTTSLKASNSPLIVLDGMIYEGDLADINSVDIERIDVMKDASSAAIYGSRSANGVIHISTKKGSSGAPSINISANLGAVTASFLRPVLGPEEYLGMREELFRYTAPRDNQPGYYSNPNFLPEGLTLSDWMSYSGASGDPVDIWLSRLALNPIEIQNYKEGKTMNWKDYVFQVGLKQDYSASVTGGNDNVKYYWSINYSNVEGFIVGDEFETVRTRLNLENKITNFLSVGVNAQFAVRNEGSVQANWNAYSRLSPYGSLYEEDGKTLKLYPHQDEQVVNPLMAREYSNRYNKYKDLNSKIYAHITLPYGFSYQLNIINNFTDNRDYRHNLSENPQNAATNGFAYRQNVNTYSWNIENLIKWNKVFGDHSFDVTFLANAEKYQYFKDRMENRYFDPSDILGFHNMGGGTTPVISSNDQSNTRDALMGRLNYVLKNKYFLTASVRRDGYSAFGRANPHAVFPSIALAWRISDESFFQVNNLDYLKLRASWGANGNSAVDAYAALAAMSGGKLLYADANGNAYTASTLGISKLANEKLKWEKTTAYNGGLDFGLFNNRLNGSIEGYFSKTTDLLVDRALPSITGLKSVSANLGQVNNYGFEITLNSVNIDLPRTLTWRTTVNMSLNKNKIKHLYGSVDENGKELDDRDNGWFIGQSIDAIWDYRPDGVWQEEDKELAARYGYLPGEYRMVDVNEDGVYSAIDDKQFLGYSKPQYRWSMTNDFLLFNNISFSFSMYGQHGWKKNYIEKFGNERESDYVISHWTPENRSMKWSRMSNRDADPKAQSNYINMSFVRLSDISLGYIFPKKITDCLHLKGLKVFGNVQNVGVWSQWPGWDPENTGGPTPRYFNFGVNVKL